MIATVHKISQADEAALSPSSISAHGVAVPGMADTAPLRVVPAVQALVPVEFRLGAEAVETSFGADSPLARQMRSYRAVSASIRASTVPADKASFRADVRRYLAMTHQHDASFRQAMQDGTLVIQTTDEVPELNFQPLIEYALYRDGVEQDSGSFSPEGFNDDLYQHLAQSRHQVRGSYGLRQFYAWWPQ